MPEADGYVRIDTQMDDSKLIRQLSSLGARLNKQLSGLEKAKQNVEDLERAFAKLSSGETKPRSVEALEKEIERTERELDKYSKQWDALKAQRSELASNNTTGANNGAIADLNERIEEIAAKFTEASNNVDALREKLAELKADPTKAEEATQIAEKLELARSEVERLSADADNTRASMEALRNSTGGVEEEVKKSKNAFEQFGNYVKRLAKRMLVLYMFRRVFTYIRNSIMSLSGINVVTGVFTDFNNKMREAYQNNTAVQNALAKLRGALYTAFAPIYNAVVPALVTLINWLSKGIQYIAAFISALSGKTLAENAEGAKDLAESVGAVGGAAKDANKQIAQFDKLNTLSENKGGGGGGGGSSGADFSDIGKGIDIAWIEKIKNKISPIIEDIKRIFRGLVEFVTGIFKGDWTLAFEGAAKVFEGFGSLVNHVISNLLVPLMDGFRGKIVEIVDGLFKYIEDKTGLDLTAIREIVATALNFMSLLVEGFAIKVGWIVQDLCDIVAAIFRNDWEGAWKGAQKLVKDASVDVSGEAYDMAVRVSTDLVETGKTSGDVAEQFISNLNEMRNAMASADGDTLQAEPTPDGTGFSFWASVKKYIPRLIKFVIPGMGLFASGGFPTAGSMFIAGEAGPELVGSFGGNNNAVVNEAQLVQAFRQASSEQVALLQQQNSLLAAILNKSGEVTFKPSSAAGKVFSQSINMYNRAMG